MANIRINNVRSPIDFVKSLNWQHNEQDDTLYLSPEDAESAAKELEDNPFGLCDDLSVLIPALDVDGYSPIYLKDGSVNNGDAYFSYDEMKVADDGSVTLEGDTAQTIVNLINNRKTTENYYEEIREPLKGEEIVNLSWRTYMEPWQKIASRVLDKDFVPLGRRQGNDFKNDLEKVFGEENVYEDKEVFKVSGKGAEKFLKLREDYRQDVVSKGGASNKDRGEAILRNIGAPARSEGSLDRA